MTRVADANVGDKFIFNWCHGNDPYNGTVAEIEFINWDSHFPFHVRFHDGTPAIVMASELSPL